MNITLTLIDDFGNELQLHDVVMIEYTNPKEKYIGVLSFDEELKQLLVFDNDRGWKSYPKHTWESIRRLGDEQLIPQLEQYFGLNQFTTRPLAKAFLKSIDSLIHDLTLKISE
jgi:hypothetical protein